MRKINKEIPLSRELTNRIIVELCRFWYRNYQETTYKKEWSR